MLEIRFTPGPDELLDLVEDATASMKIRKEIT